MELSASGFGREEKCAWILPMVLVVHIIQTVGCTEPSSRLSHERAGLLDAHQIHASEAYIRFSYGDRPELDRLTRLVSISNVRDGQVWAYATLSQLEGLYDLGYTWTELPHPGINPDVQMGLFDKNGNKLWDHYPTYSEYVDVMHQFADDYPNLCRLYDIGDSTNQSRPHELWAIKITDNPDATEDEPEVFYTSTMHGDETTGYPVLLQLIEELLSNHGTDSEITDLVDNLEIWINPLANPDGTYYGGDNTVGSAIRSFTNSSGNSSGVDPNRNFPDPLYGDHPDGNSWWRETAAMMDFAADHSFVISANFHGGAEVVNYPWDHRSARHTDDEWFAQVSREYADNCHADGWGGYMTDLSNGITNGYDWYMIDGGRQDYMTYFHGCREVTIEISGTPTPSASSLDDYWQANRQALLDYLKHALTGIRGTVTSQSGQPLPATVRVLGFDDEGDNPFVYTDPASGDYHRMLVPGSYDLRFTSDGYESEDELFVTVAMGPATRVDVVLELVACSSAADCDLWNVNQHDCDQGDCLIVSCDAGWGDCNQIDADGCEKDLTSDPLNCGACSNSCNLPNATPQCVDGGCQIASCLGGFQDCNMNPLDGCEADASVDPQNCGACNNACLFPHSQPTCQAGSCVMGTCDGLWGNCDGNPANGCEASLSFDPDNCGECGQACDFANADASCASGACQMGACLQGFGDCNLNESDGCESDLASDPGHCGDCGLACHLPNALPACSFGTCSLGSCEDLYGDCNGILEDGCEVSLADDPDNCGQCDNACVSSGASASCRQGICQLDDCQPGRGDCNGNPQDGCETDLQNNPLNCGACLIVCPPGQPCQAGVCQGACRDIDGDGYLDQACGGDDCNDTEAIYNPGATEVCNEYDDDCNGLVDDGISCSVIGCGCSSAQETSAGTLLLLGLLGLCRRRRH